jgi:hypothetical protein
MLYCTFIRVIVSLVVFTAAPDRHTSGIQPECERKNYYTTMTFRPSFRHFLGQFEKYRPNFRKWTPSDIFGQRFS